MARGMEPLLNRTLPRPEDLCPPVCATEFVLVGRRFASWLERVPVLNDTAAPSGFIDLPNLYEPSRVEATLALTVHGGILAWAGGSVFSFMRNGSGGTVAPSGRAAITKRPKTAAACAVVTGAYLLLMQFLRT
jgi:hypothetical protein